MQRLEHSPDLAVDNLHDLRIAVEAPLPVAERHFYNAKLQILKSTRVRVLLDSRRSLRRIVGSAAPYALLEIVDPDLSGWLVVLQILPRFPIGGQRRVSVRLWGF